MLYISWNFPAIAAYLVVVFRIFGSLQVVYPKGGPALFKCCTDAVIPSRFKSIEDSKSPNTVFQTYISCREHDVWEQGLLPRL